jgi:hypothetical protein
MWKRLRTLEHEIVAEIDAFATQLLEEAKAFFEKARATSEEKSKEAYLHAALNLGFCAVEAHLNAIADDFLTLDSLSHNDKSILSEKKIEVDHGEFRVTERLQIYRLEDRLLFLCARFSKKGPLDRSAVYWGHFKEALVLRNGLTHPKVPTVVSETSVERALLSILQVLDVMYTRIYRKRYPARKRGLQSTIDL